MTDAYKILVYKEGPARRVTEAEAIGCFSLSSHSFRQAISEAEDRIASEFPGCDFILACESEKEETIYF